MRELRSSRMAYFGMGMAVILMVWWFVALPLQRAPMDRALVAAVKRDDASMTSLLLQRGANPNVKEDSGIELATWAIVQAHPQMAALLLEHHARIDTRFCLLDAMTKNDASTVLLLIQYGADPNLRDPGGFTPLLRFGNDPATDKELIAHGADVNAHGPDGATALMTAACGEATPYGTMDTTAIPEAVRLLLQHGADANARDKKGDTPLLWAMRTHYSPAPAEVIRSLMQAGADVNARGSTGKTPLIEAAGRNNAPVVQTLLEHGADPNIRDALGRTALMVAAANPETEGAVQATALLLKHGADPALKNPAGLTALQIARAEAHKNPHQYTPWYTSQRVAAVLTTGVVPPHDAP